jgi:predicted small secreted protein
MIPPQTRFAPKPLKWSITALLMLALTFAACSQPNTVQGSSGQSDSSGGLSPRATLDRFTSPTDLTTTAWSGGDVSLWREPVATSADPDGYLDSMYSLTAGGYTGSALSNAARSGTVQIKFFVHAPKASASAPVGLYVNSARDYR